MTEKETTMTDPVSQELLQLNQRLLESIARADWPTYEQLCDPSLSAFEPESRGQLVEGMPFHRFYFDLGGVQGEHNTTMASPHVRVMGDVAVVAYVRLNQRVDAQGKPVESAVEETRVWQRQGGRWRHVHFHRSPVPY
jgi:calcium/calmodulin-dependent protein kinase (CaM kinase) II